LPSSSSTPRRSSHRSSLSAAAHSSHPSSPEAVRRNGEVVLPLWQPDADVTHCPVCYRQFTFFYRKHHCRYVRSISLWLTLSYDRH
jgi:hypothetical protein